LDEPTDVDERDISLALPWWSPLVEEDEDEDDEEAVTVMWGVSIFWNYSFPEQLRSA
jgi:hypothetical protein